MIERGDVVLNPNNIKTGIKVSDWREAIRAAGDILVDVGSCETGYVDAMVSSVEELGPYIVITPHVALAHARPSADVKIADMSLVVLDEAVEFGSEANDPVKLVFAFCATDNESHLEKLGSLAKNLNPDTINELLNAKGVDEVLAILS